ncbi:MAG: hypothetical protein HRU19_26600 [Pseudobacteriovorax sp.]|nr:hypothetical protein [Pseudobacteriovorax sp.]
MSHFIFICFIFGLSQISFAKVIDISSEDFDGRGFGEDSYWYLGDETYAAVKSTQFEEKFKPGHSEFLNFGMLQPDLWVRYDFNNPFPTTQTIYLFDQVNSAEELSVYVETGTRSTLASEDSIHSRIVPIQLAPGKQTRVFIKRFVNGSQKQSWSFYLDRELITEKIRSSERNWAVLQAVFVMTIFFNLMLLFAYKSIVYIYYLLYILSFAIAATTKWSIVGGIHLAEWTIVLGSIVAIFSSLFSIEFLNLRRPGLRWGRFFHVGVIALSAGVIMITWISPTAGPPIFFPLNFVAAIASLCIASYAFYREREIHCLIYIISYGVFLSGAATQMAIWAGHFPMLADQNHLIFYASGLENVLMLVALGYKVYSSENERIRNYQELRHSYAQLAKTYFPHQLNMIRSGRELESTMPIAEKTATVIAFDVVASSKALFPGFKDSLEKFFGRCRHIAAGNYDGENLLANGFIIKEMGDGFLCSVGFPFLSPDESRQSHSAVLLAERFVEEFRKVMVEAGYPRSIHCAVGIARGPVEGYFSKAQVVRYDLFGRGIVLATRYESARRLLFQNIGECTVVILQDEVFHSLPEDVKGLYKSFSLSKPQQQIRDDPGATVFYYREYQDVVFDEVG